MVDRMNAAVVERGAMQVEALQWYERLMLLGETKGLVEKQSRP